MERIKDGERTIEITESEIMQFLSEKGLTYSVLKRSDNHLQFQILKDDSTALSTKDLEQMRTTLTQRCFTIRENELVIKEEHYKVLPDDQSTSDSVFSLELRLDKPIKSE